MTNSDRPHLEILELVPWYVNGTLGEREMDQVSGHVESCASCSQAIDQEVTMAQHLRATPAGLAKLLEQQPQAFTRLQESLPSSSGQQRSWYRPALAATIAAVALTSFFIGRASLDSTYELMTDTASYDGYVLQLIFHPQTSEQDIRHLLTDTGGDLLGNPSPKGVYRINLPPNIDAKAYAARIQEHPAVRWAELELR